ncbi:hypothetical protein J7T55_004458 [Diaporthe amygdali]|uniref:uncharacterized protein n=1 Tax=Phomopsis amygdali TaxID=1214568 RepID=UPI0022FF2435|nr:uncharacterized protein J7T55_004458 [Diaporthe amygdali]KAJ0109908.1 hypothetical protein J7T55_004458 [Diaporthe amygdali]
MSEQEIIEEGRYLVESFQVLRDYALSVSKPPEQELDSREFSRFTELFKLVLTDIEKMHDLNKAREAEIVKRKGEIEALHSDAEVLHRDAEKHRFEMSTAAEEALSTNNSASNTAQQLESMRLAAERERRELQVALERVAGTETSLSEREKAIERAEQTALEARGAAEEQSRLTALSWQRNRTLVTTNEDLRASLEGDQEEARQAKQRYEDAEAQVVRNREYLSQEREDVAEIKEQLEQQRASAAEIRTQLEQEMASIAERQASLDEQVRLMQAQTEQSDALRSEADALKSEADAVKSEAERRKNQAERLMEDATAQAERAKQLERDATSQSTSAEHKEQLAEQARSQAVQDRDLVMADRAQASKDNESIRSLLENIKEQAAQAAQDRAAAESCLKTAEERMAKDQADGKVLVQQAQVEREEARKCHANAASLLEEVKDQKAQLDEERAVAAVSVEEARAQQAEYCSVAASSLERAKEVLAASDTVIQEKIQDLERANKVLETKLEKKTEESDGRYDDWLSLRASMDAKDLDVRRGARQLEEAEEKVSDLSGTVRELKAKLQSAEDRAKSWESKVDDYLADACEGLKIQNQDQKSMAFLQEYQEELEGYENTLREKLDSELAVYGERSDEISAEIAEVSAQLEAVKENSEQELKTLQKQLLDKDRELQGFREESKRLRTDRGNREAEIRQECRAAADFEKQRADGLAAELQRYRLLTEGSPWKETLQRVFEYIAGLDLDHRSQSHGPGFRGLDDERLIRPLTYILAREDKRENFTAFLDSTSKPDGWYCMDQVCGTDHDAVEPVDGECPFHSYTDCRLQVRHLDASSKGKTLDCRVPFPEEDDEEDDEDEDEDEGGVQLID